jgi:hypothetical protein
MENKNNIHEQLFDLLQEKYITRGEYLISLKENLFTLKDKIKIHEQLDELLKNDYITKDEYLIFIKENLKSNEETKTNISKEIKNSENLVLDKNMIQRIKNAGSNVMGIYYYVIFLLIISYLYNLLLDVKSQYFLREQGIISDYSQTSKITKFILNLDNINFIVENLKYLSEFYYLIQFIVFPIFLMDLYNLGYNLKNIDKKI